MKKFVLVGLLMSIVLAMSCGDDGPVFFSIEDDIALGKQVRDQIAEDTSFVILDPEQYAFAYNFMNAMRDEILASPEIQYDTLFEWEIYIIHDDETLNAFATPGGYIYVYTGLIKFLEQSDDLAGVLGHEIAHSDRRHSVRQLQTQLGISTLLSIALGEDPDKLSEVVGTISGNLAGLTFSRNHESEADEYSVRYLESTPYQCDGAKSFFEKLLEEELTGSQPAFLSTHPDPEDRVEDISALAGTFPSCTGKAQVNQQSFLSLKVNLPR
ncbi:MAG: M48 family metalloprotease [bacterium]|nr:M48 family metalloprotease [bacterium]